MSVSDVNSAIGGMENKNTGIDSGVLGSPVTQAESGVRGLGEGVYTFVQSGIKSSQILGFNILSGLSGLAEVGVGSGVAGLDQTSIHSAIIGGEVDVFGFSFPLADLMPLRNTTVWGKFKDVQTIPYVYGCVSLAPVAYDDKGKLFVLADHPIESVDEVQIDNSLTLNWVFRNTVDSTGVGIALLELGEELESGAFLSVQVRGKIHPEFGNLLTNPADIVWDILANICGAVIEYGDLDQFRVECAQYGITINGMLDNEERSARGQIDLIMDSIGAIWSGGMPSLARIYPVEE